MNRLTEEEKALIPLIVEVAFALDKKVTFTKDSKNSYMIARQDDGCWRNLRAMAENLLLESKKKCNELCNLSAQALADNDQLQESAEKLEVLMNPKATEG